MKQEKIKIAKSKAKAEVQPTLQIVTAEHLDTGVPVQPSRQRSALVNHFLLLSEQIEQDIERILKL